MKINISKKVIILLPALLIFSGCAIWGNPKSDLKVVDSVDVERYMGKWYEIARYPNSFQSSCASDTTATYRLEEDGEFSVINQCTGEDGKSISAEASAWAVDESNAKIKVQFFWPFRGDYWIIDLGINYEYAVVGHPYRTYLWILSRTPEMDPATYAGILKRLEDQKYDTSKLVKTKQTTK